MPWTATGGTFKRMSTPQTTHTVSEQRYSQWLNIVVLLISLLGVATVFLPFAFNTSPWDAIRFRVPENQGNWWHALVAAPFFVTFPLVWLRIRAVWSDMLSTSAERRFVWIFTGLSVVGTVAVETPFLLHLAGTSEWQRFLVLGLGLGIVVASAALLFAQRHSIPATRACIVALNTAYLANAGLCLVVYAGATGPVRSRTGWLVTAGIVWPMLYEVCAIFVASFRTR